jgi:UDP-N-acetyl-D-glucosamine dehydrogenase
MLRKKGAEVTFTDTHVQNVSLPDGTALDGMSLDEADLGTTDCVVIVTDHSDFPWERIVKESPLILDTRNALKGFKAQNIRKL